MTRVKGQSSFRGGNEVADKVMAVYVTADASNRIIPGGLLLQLKQKKKRLKVQHSCSEKEQMQGFFLVII